uniref:Uncharacterized protein n=1 Tax=Setaria viridis TaxID=4556 RepID=A0A4U6UGK7_SETVI|nr:hypothetical protein SEVIR_5G142350v2 [Setaria viridis]
MGLWGKVWQVLRARVLAWAHRLVRIRVWANSDRSTHCSVQHLPLLPYAP